MGARNPAPGRWGDGSGAGWYSRGTSENLLPGQRYVPMRNIEMKALLPNRDSARAACERIGAEFQGDLHQVDTYFTVPHGRLKMRVANPGSSELIYYHRADQAGAKGCDYTLEPMSPSAVEILGEALGILARVEKVRTLYIWENVRIHLDNVMHLGEFVEFEAVLGEGHDDASGFKKLTYLADIFNISEKDYLKYSYLDMMLDHG